jgi:hypothetical protein
MAADHEQANAPTPWTLTHYSDVSSVAVVDRNGTALFYCTRALAEQIIAAACTAQERTAQAQMQEGAR